MCFSDCLFSSSAGGRGKKHSNSVVFIAIASQLFLTQSSLPSTEATTGTFPFSIGSGTGNKVALKEGATGRQAVVYCVQRF